MTQDSNTTTSKKDVLIEASQLLQQPSKNTKRKILIAVNVTFVIVALLHLSIQLIQFGKLPDPERDMVLFPLLLIINAFSAIYNLRVLLLDLQGNTFLNRFTVWSSMIILQLLAVLVVHTNPNSANSILFDFVLSSVVLFIVGTALNRTAAIIWLCICFISLYVAYHTRGTDFTYYLMTKQEVAELSAKVAAKDPAALQRMETAAKEHIVPLPLSLYVTIWFIFLLLAFLPTYFESGMIGQILKVIPEVIQRIQIASEQKSQLERENIRMGMELDVARRIQTMLLPYQDEFDKCKDLDVSARMDTATEVGGDFYEVLPQADGSTYFGIGDVTDHGLQSGVVMLMTQSAIRSLLDGNTIHLPEALSQINTILYKNIQNRMNDRRNLTLSLLHYQNGKVRLTGQHESVILLRKDEEKPVLIDTLDLGIYVGLTDDSFTDFVKEISFDFQKGDIMVLYTDGATEAENEKGELYGVERLMDSLPKYRHLKSNEIVAKMTEDIYLFIGRKPILDDISLVVIQRT